MEIVTFRRIVSETGAQMTFTFFADILAFFKLTLHAELDLEIRKNEIIANRLETKTPKC